MKREDTKKDSGHGKGVYIRRIERIERNACHAAAYDSINTTFNGLNLGGR